MIQEAYCSFEIAKLLKEKGFDVKPYGSYYVARTGEVFGPKGDIMKPNKSNRGYLRLYLTVNGKRQQVSVHRLVALLFCPNPDMKLEVNHIDGNKENNNASNLEWCTHSENEQHARATGLKLPVIGKYLGKDNKLSKPFVCVETGKVYYCLRELWEELGYDKNCCSHIARACKYGYLDHGYNWRYYEPNELVKLLFEKGYRKYPLSYDGDEWYCYVQMAMAWLREAHNIHIAIVPCEVSPGVMDYTYILYKVDVENFIFKNLGIQGRANTDKMSASKTCEAALKYVLENLI